MAEYEADRSKYAQHVDAPLLIATEKSLAGKSALITGATRFNGIGFAIAERFALEGASPIILVGTTRSQDIAPHAQERLRKYGIEIYTLVGDVTKGESCTEMMKTAYGWCDGNVNVLVNNAGTNRDRALGQITEEDWSYIMRPKTLGAVLMTNEWYRIRNNERIKGGCVINIGSIIGRRGNVGQGLYAMANGALVGLTMSQSWELRGLDVTVNLIEPGFVEGTDMTAEISKDRDRVEVIKAVSARSELVRPQDVAGAAAYLAGPYGERITGTILTVDCGIASNYTAARNMHLDGFRKIPRQILAHIREWPGDLMEIFRRGNA